MLTIGLSLPLLVGAQPVVTDAGPEGYLERAKLMYDSHNYVGAIDQLTHLQQLPLSADLEEEA